MIENAKNPRKSVYVPNDPAKPLQGQGQGIFQAVVDRSKDFAHSLPRRSRTPGGDCRVASRAPRQALKLIRQEGRVRTAGLKGVGRRRPPWW